MIRSEKYACRFGVSAQFGRWFQNDGTVQSRLRYRAASVQEQRKVGFCKDVHCAAERPALHKAVRRVRCVIRRAAQAHGMQRVGEELRLKAVHSAEHLHPLPCVQQILIGQARKHQFISLHTFSF